MNRPFLQVRMLKASKVEMDLTLINLSFLQVRRSWKLQHLRSRLDIHQLNAWIPMPGSIFCGACGDFSTLSRDTAPTRLGKVSCGMDVLQGHLCLVLRLRLFLGRMRRRVAFELCALCTGESADRATDGAAVPSLGAEKVAGSLHVPCGPLHGQHGDVAHVS